MLKKFNLCVGISALSLVIFFIIKTLVLLEIIPSTRETRAWEFSLLVLFIGFYIIYRLWLYIKSTMIKIILKIYNLFLVSKYIIFRELEREGIVKIKFI